jgi:hypothetical protein
MLSISASPSTISEGGGATYTISASTINPFQPTTVRFAMSGKARLGSDYTVDGNFGQIDIPAGASSVALNLHALRDTAREKVESATMTLNQGADYRLPAKAARKATVRIVNSAP